MKTTLTDGCEMAKKVGIVQANSKRVEVIDPETMQPVDYFVNAAAFCRFYGISQQRASRYLTSKRRAKFNGYLCRYEGDDYWAEHMLNEVKSGRKKIETNNEQQMEETIEYVKHEQALPATENDYTVNRETIKWSHDTIRKIFDALDEQITSGKTLTAQRMQLLALDVINIELDKLRNQIRKDFYGTLKDKGIKDVVLSACYYYGCQPEDIERKSSKREHLEPRQLIHWMIQKQVVPNSMTLEQIGKLTGGYDHSTVLHSKKVVGNRLQTEKSFRNDIMKILNGFGYRCTFEDGELKWVLVG